MLLAYLQTLNIYFIIKKCMRLLKINSWFDSKTIIKMVYLAKLYQFTKLIICDIKIFSIHIGFKLTNS